jgi:hypothetical protein
MATPIYSVRVGQNPFIQVSEGTPVQRLFNAIMREKFYQSSARVNFKHNRYNYQPTDDYKNYVIRFRGIEQI